MQVNDSQKDDGFTIKGALVGLVAYLIIIFLLIVLLR
jgi:hypothetical protein